MKKNGLFFIILSGMFGVILGLSFYVALIFFKGQIIDQSFVKNEMQVKFFSQAVKMQGNQRFQFFTLKQIEVLEKKSLAAIKWINLSLPDVVVGAIIPVTYTYFLELNDTWELDYQNDILMVKVPQIYFNEPAVDVSHMELLVTKGSIFRNEQIVLDQLKTSIMDYLRMRAQENINLIKENGKKEIEAFILKWITTHYQFKDNIKVQIEFSKETLKELR